MITLTTRRNFVLGGGSIAIALAAAPRAAAAIQSVRIATGVRGTLQSLGWLGAQTGIFQRLGLKVEFARIEAGGPQAATGLYRGDWEFCETGTSPIVQGVLDGHDTVILLVPSRPHVSGYILARPDIKEPAGLANQRIGVLTETGQFAIATRAMLRKWGVSATLVPLGSFPNIYAALKAGTIDAAYFTLDWRVLAKRELGANDFAGPAALQNAVLATTRRLIAQDPDLVARMVRGYVETIHTFKTNRSVILPLLQQFLQFNEPRSVEEIHEFYAATFQELPRSTDEGIKAVLEQFAQRYPAANTLAPSQVVDRSFLDELEKTGFVAKLYQRN